MEANDFFKYHGKTAKDFGLLVTNEVVFTTPQQDVEFQEIPGLDGDLAMDNKRLKSVDKVFPVSVFSVNGWSLLEQSKQIAAWLRKDVGWNDLEIAKDPDYLYKAIHYEQYDIQQIVAHYGRGVIKFRMKPIKYLKNGLEPEHISNGRIVYNPESRRSLPLLQITGSGDITINIGSQKLVLKAIDGSITIDSRSQSVTKGGLNQFEKMYSYPFPQLNPGGNKITWSGNISRLDITPRWEAVI